MFVIRNEEYININKVAQAKGLKSNRSISNFKKNKIKLPLKSQSTTDASTRYGKGLDTQVEIFGEGIRNIKANTASKINIVLQIFKLSTSPRAVNIFLISLKNSDNLLLLRNFSTQKKSSFYKMNSFLIVLQIFIRFFYRSTDNPFNFGCVYVII